MQLNLKSYVTQNMFYHLFNSLKKKLLDFVFLCNVIIH